MNVSFRDYQASDFEVCRSLWAELTLYHQDIYGDPTIGGDDPGRGFEAYLNNTERRGTWVAELKGEVVAFSGLLVHWEEEGEVKPVIVSSTYRRKGIGTMLVQHVIEEAKKSRIRFLGARPVARNKDAISFFIRLGFNTMGQIELFQELSPSPERTWKPGIAIHGKELRY